MYRTRSKVALAVLAVGGLLSGAGALAYGTGNDKPGKLPPKEAPPPQEKKPDRTAVVPVPADTRAQATTLRYKLKPSEMFRYVVEKKTETHSTSPALARSVTTTQTYDVTWRVTGMNADGNALIKLTIDRIRFTEHEGFGGNVDFDSKKHAKPEGVPAVVRVLTNVLKAQAGAEFTFSMDPFGEVSNFNVPKKLADALKIVRGGQGIDSAESFRYLLASQGSVVLPKDSVFKGAGWSEKTESAVSGGHAKLNVLTKATYQGELERQGQKFEEITLTPSSAAVERAPFSGLGQFTLKNHEGKGSVLFDNDHGRLVESHVTQTADMESGAPGQTVVWKVTQSISSKLIKPN